MAVRAVGAATARGACAGAAASLVGVVETAALKFNAAGRERLGRRGTAARAHDLGSLGHGMLNLKHVAATARVFTTRITGIIVLLRSLLLSLSCFFLSLSLIFSLGLIYIINTSLITTDLFIDLINELLRILFGIFKNKLLIVFIRNIIKKAIKAIYMLLERVGIFSRIYIKINMVS